MLFSLIWFLIIGMIAGWLAGQFTTGRGFGAVNNMIVGVLGAIVGGFLFDLVGFDAHGPIATVITATVGAIVVLYLLNRYGRRI